MSAGDAMLARVLEIVRQTAGAHRTPAGAGPDTPLRHDGFWLDSIDLLEITVACAEEFLVEFDGVTDLTPETLASPRTLAALIRAKREEAARRTR